MARRPSLFSLKTAREQEAYRRAMDVHTYLLQSERDPSRFPPLSRRELASQFGTTERSVEKYLGSAIERSEDMWAPQPEDTLVKRMTIITPDGVLQDVPIRGAANRAAIAKHHAEVEAFLKTGDPAHLRQVRKTTIVDAAGCRHRLATDADDIRRLNRAGELRGVTPY